MHGNGRTRACSRVQEISTSAGLALWRFSLSIFYSGSRKQRFQCRECGEFFHSHTATSRGYLLLFLLNLDRGFRIFRAMIWRPPSLRLRRDIFCKAKNGGKGIRTPDFQLAKLALYQLSYAPPPQKVYSLWLRLDRTSNPIF